MCIELCYPLAKYLADTRSEMFSYLLAAITVQGAASQIVNHRAIAIDFADFQVRQAGVPRSEWREGHQRSAMVRSKCGIDEFHKGMSSNSSRHLYSFRF